MGWHKYEGIRFDIETADSCQTDQGGYKGTVKLRITDKGSENRVIERTGRWEIIGNFSPIWVQLEGQEVTVEELLRVPLGADLINYGETVVKPGKNAKFVKRFRYLIPNEGPMLRKLMYVSPGAFILYREKDDDTLEMARVLDRVIFDGAGERLEGIWLRCMVAPLTLEHAYQRYVKIDWIRDCMTAPSDMARFFFWPNLPDAETVIQWMNYGSVSQQFVGEKLKELERANTQDTGARGGIQGGVVAEGDGPVPDPI